MFKRVNFGDSPPSRFMLSASKAPEGFSGESRAEAWIDGLPGCKTGRMIAVSEVKNTKASHIFETFPGDISEPVTGIHDLYIVFFGDSSNLFYLKSVWLEVTGAIQNRNF